MIYDTKYLLDIFNKDCNGTALKVSDGEELREYIADSLHTAEVISAFSELRLKLSSAFNLDTVSFVTGNGTSMYAGSNDTRRFDLAAYTLDPDYNLIKAEVDHIKSSDMETALNQLNILCEQKKIVGETSLYVQYQKLITAIKADLIDSFVNSIDYNKLFAHDILFRKLRSFGCINRVNIFTANYDLAYEYALDRLDIDYNDGFSGFVNRKFSPKELESSHILTLDKFHGSVNWVDDATSIGSDSIKEVQPRFVEIIVKDKDGKNVKELKVEMEANTEHVLIYPTSNKLYQTYSAPYSELMRFMLDRFEAKRNVIIVVGYKYGDDHINEIMVKALANPGNVFWFLDFDEDPGNSFINNMKKLSVSMPNINILSGNILADFPTFVKYIIPATYEKTDEERIAELLMNITGGGRGSSTITSTAAASA